MFYFDFLNDLCPLFTKVVLKWAQGQNKILHLLAPYFRTFDWVLISWYIIEVKLTNEVKTM